MSGGVLSHAHKLVAQLNSCARSTSHALTMDISSCYSGGGGGGGGGGGLDFVYPHERPLSQGSHNYYTILGALLNISNTRALQQSITNHFTFYSLGVTTDRASFERS